MKFCPTAITRSTLRVITSYLKIRLKFDYIQIKALEQCFPVIMLITLIVLYKVVLTFESVDEILKCDY